MGSAAIVNIVLGIIRLKIFAILLGPAGVGLAGLYTNLMALSSTVSGLGMGSSGVRQVARSNNDELRRSVVLKALWLSGLGLGVLGGGTTYFLRE
ncbi:MAG: oligosaccharide flippase family protein, partial [Parvibaculum sp.]|nr:oligosaccharide flippase family protein [Parvibaculum sp.]